MKPVTELARLISVFKLPLSLQLNGTGSRSPEAAASGLEAGQNIGGRQG